MNETWNLSDFSAKTVGKLCYEIEIIEAQNLFTFSTKKWVFIVEKSEKGMLYMYSLYDISDAWVIFCR